MKNILFLLFTFIIGSTLINKEPPAKSQSQVRVPDTIYAKNNINLDSLHVQINNELDSIAFSIKEKKSYKLKAVTLQKKNAELVKQLQDSQKIIEELSSRQ